jgi:MoaA/NifB/PqqE/SkfB family radical SAM enzyme
MSKRLIGGSADMSERFAAVARYSKKIRASEYILSNACNIRCEGCWFFDGGHDTATKEVKDLGLIRDFIAQEVARGVNTALLIGGEPTLYPLRIAEYVAQMERVTISTNGLKPFPVAGFENVAVAVTLFGGGPTDDKLRAIRPNGARFTGLFETALRNYRADPRAHFIYAINEEGIDYMDETVDRIAQNGNGVTFNFYSAYGTDDPLRISSQPRLLEAAHRVAEKYPDVCTSPKVYIDAMITGKTPWGEFGYDVCPSISVDHPIHKERLANGNPALDKFNAWAPDLKTTQFCCTSGKCEGCRDSQAVYSWLLKSAARFAKSDLGIEGWVELAESYWSQFVWSPYFKTKRQPTNESQKRVFDILPA